MSEVEVRLLVNGAVVRTMRTKGAEKSTVSGAANVLLEEDAVVEVQIVSTGPDVRTVAGESFLAVTRERLD